jgi:hypothetical protein
MATPHKPALAEPVVQLYRNVVERLNRDVRIAIEANRPQGAEIGGLLLGTADPQAASIDVQDFEPLSGEARSDGRFIISGSERDKLESALRQRSSQPQVVGCYRSHIGPALTLGVDDFALAQVCLHNSGGLFLLIQPSPDGSVKAGFFVWPDSHIDSKFSFHECSLDKQLQVAQLPLPSSARPLLAERPGVTGLGDTPSRQPWQVERHRKSANVLIRLGYAFRHRAKHWRADTLGRFAALLSRARAIRWRTRARGLWRAMVARPLYPVLALSIVAACMLAYIVSPDFRSFGITPSSAELDLQVNRREGNLRVNWNQNAPMVQRARGAVLTIRDGESPPVALELEPEQLRDGSIVYSPKSGRVQFSLEIIAPNGVKTSESVLALASQTSTASTRMTALRPPSADRPSRDRSNLPPLASGRDFTGEKSVRVGPADADVRSTSVPTPTPAERVEPPLTNPPAAKTAEAASSAVYIPPRTLHELRPVLSTAIRATMTSEVELQVKVKIDDAGRVTQADTLTATGPATRRLMDVTEKVARLWKFAPAMRGSEPVPSEAVVVFRFRPSPE